MVICFYNFGQLNTLNLLDFEIAILTISVALNHSMVLNNNHAVTGESHDDNINIARNVLIEIINCSC